MQMLLIHASALLGLITAAHGSPVSTNLRSGKAIFVQSGDSINDCGDSTYESQTTDGSPFISDCQQIAANIAGGGSWNFESSGHHQLVEYGSCAFGVETYCDKEHHQCPAGGIITKIGNQDIIDIINESIKQFPWEGKVGARGKMKCQEAGSGHDIPVLWGIYNDYTAKRLARDSRFANESQTSINDCEASTFEDQSTPASPLVADCRQIAINIAGGGSWIWDAGGLRQVAQYGTCAFGVQAECDNIKCPPPGTLLKIGNQDIIDLINDSIAKFTWFDKVGAKGDMRCQQEGSKNTHLVRWGLYNSWNKPERLARGSPKALAARNTGLSRRMANDCGLTDIVDQTTEGSPLIEDCKEIVRIYNTDQMTTFTFEADGSQHRVFQTGTCAFGVQTYCPNGQCPKKGILVKIGDEDVRDLVQLSIDTFPWKGRVGALGHMICQQEITNDDIPVLWGVYHRNDLRRRLASANITNVGLDA